MTNEDIYDSLDEIYDELEANMKETNRKIWLDGGSDDDQKRADAIFKALNSLWDALYYMHEANDKN